MRDSLGFCPVGCQAVKKGSNLIEEKKMTHASLVALGVRWLSCQSSAVFYEFAASAKENPDIIAWSAGLSTLIECKATRSDFLGDSKKTVRRNPRRGMGQRRYYLCPAGVIKVEELPKKWGLLWVE